MLDAGLRPFSESLVIAAILIVLILIMLDAGLRRFLKKFFQKRKKFVLILIMLDAGLRPKVTIDIKSDKCSLNPYYVGCWSQTDLWYENELNIFFGLNPYYVGCWSQTEEVRTNKIVTIES